MKHSGKEKLDVLIIGGGITGLATAHNLKEMGIKRFAILDTGASDSPIGTSASSMVAGLASATMPDNVTRLVNAHGIETTRELYCFARKGFDALSAYCTKSGVAWTPARRLRLLMSAHESEEAQVALSQLETLGISAKLYRPEKFPIAFAASGVAIKKANVQAVQEEGAGKLAAVVDARALLASLRKDLQPYIQAAKVLRLEEKQGAVLVFCEGEEHPRRAEFVVIAAHLGVRALLPSLDDVAVAINDQWSAFRTERASLQPSAEFQSLAFSAMHSYYWGIAARPGLWHVGGGRQLRKFAGIGSAHAEASEKVRDHVAKMLNENFFEAPYFSLVDEKIHAAQDCTPCDELPVIGPMYGMSRVLISFGYLGNGLALAFAAAKALSALITKGSSAELPRKFYPERLRSL